jgi:hypothetical protein
MRRHALIPRSLIPLLLAVLFFTAPASAQNLVQRNFGRWHRGVFGVRAGIINSTTMKVGDREYTSNVALIGGVLFDAPLTRKTTIGVTADLLDIQVFDERQKALDVGITFKYAIYREYTRMALKPGLGVGYAYLARIGYLDASGYLTLKTFLEAIFYVDRRFAWIADIDILWAPVGGNREYDVTYGPAVIARFGVVL